jgi:NTP pyrophosphatase (non-canonical NTP hydrolase)
VPVAVRRSSIRPASRERLLAELASALERRVSKHGDGAFVGPHEGLGVIVEEYDELLDAVRSNDRRRVRDEAMDVAVGALWLVASIDMKGGRS